MREGGFSGIIVEFVCVSVCVRRVWEWFGLFPFTLRRFHRIESTNVCETVVERETGGGENLPLIRARDHPSQLNITQHNIKQNYISLFLQLCT